MNRCSGSWAGEERLVWRFSCTALPASASASCARGSLAVRAASASGTAASGCGSGTTRAGCTRLAAQGHLWLPAPAASSGCLQETAKQAIHANPCPQQWHAQKIAAAAMSAAIRGRPTTIQLMHAVGDPGFAAEGSLTGAGGDAGPELALVSDSDSGGACGGRRAGQSVRGVYLCSNAAGLTATTPFDPPTCRWHLHTPPLSPARYQGAEGCQQAVLAVAAARQPNC